MRTLVSLGTIILLLAVSANAGAQVLTVAHVAVDGQYPPYNVGLKKMQDVLDSKTGGKIKLKIFAGGSLSSDEKEMLTMIQSGSLDMAIVAPSPVSQASCRRARFAAAATVSTAAVS